MQNSPEFVQHCIISGREGAFHDEPSLEDVFKPPRSCPWRCCRLLSVDARRAEVIRLLGRPGRKAFLQRGNAEPQPFGKSIRPTWRTFSRTT
jgi:hypothetical protein